MAQESHDSHSLRCDKRPRFRTVGAVSILLPALSLGGFQIISYPDPEYWLSQMTQGYARRDAFEGVTNILPLFSTFVASTSLFAAFCVWRRRTDFLIPLVVGPFLASLIYLIMHGINDPAWFTLLALLTIGMLVGSPVTALWFAISKQTT